MRPSPHRFAFLLVFLMGLLAACSPSLSPLYRDYEVQVGRERLPEQMAVYGDIRTALSAAGWETTPASAPNAVATKPRTLSNWGLYRVVVSLEVVPIGTDYVRVYFHPTAATSPAAAARSPTSSGTCGSNSCQT